VYFGAGFLLGQTGGCTSHYQACCVVPWVAQSCHLFRTLLTAGDDLCGLFVVTARPPLMCQKCHCYHHRGASGPCKRSNNITSTTNTSFCYRTEAHFSSCLYNITS
jgi:hypothetical protein